MALRPRMAFFCAFFIATACALSTAPSRAQTLTVFAAASLTDALGEVLRRYDASGFGTTIASFAASSALARQIERGAPADLFISADQPWMDYLAKDGLINPKTRTDVLRNRLVLIASAKSTTKLSIVHGFPLRQFLGNSRLAMGDPLHVPAGRYGKSALVSLGVWSTVDSRIAAAENVRAAVNYVARGEAALGIVYATDVVNSPVRVVGVFPENSHPAIEYPMAIVTATRYPRAARMLLDYLRSAEAGEIFARYGFLPAR